MSDSTEMKPCWKCGSQPEDVTTTGFCVYVTRCPNGCWSFQDIYSHKESRRRWQNAHPPEDYRLGYQHGLDSRPTEEAVYKRGHAQALEDAKDLLGVARREEREAILEIISELGAKAIMHDDYVSAPNLKKIIQVIKRRDKSPDLIDMPGVGTVPNPKERDHE